MHAKMTRDRKKCFLATMEKSIDDLEQELARLRSMLRMSDDSELMACDTLCTEGAKETLNMVTPELAPLPSPDDTAVSCRMESIVTASLPSSPEEQDAKRPCHGFLLDG